MKKWMCLVLTVCMMLTMSLTAWADGTGAVLQDEQAPRLVGKQLDDGTIAYAIIYDAQGNQVAAVTDEGLVGLTDVSARDEVEDEAVAGRLTNAYSGMMNSEHFGDVLGADVSDAAGALSLTSHDLVVFEKFDVALSGDAAAYLTEGSYVEMTFALNPEQSSTLIVAVSADGNAWKIVDYVVPGEGDTVTIRMPELGVVVFMQQHYAAASDDADGAVTEDAADDAENDTAANNFTPSVTGKAAPTLVASTDENGDAYIAAIQDPEGGEGILVRNDGALVVTPLSERKQATDIHTYEHLEWAYDVIMKAEVLGDLAAHDSADGIGTHIDLVLGDLETGLTHHDMIVRDLFEVTVYGEYVSPFYNENTNITMTFDAGIAQGTPLVVLVSSDSATWHSLPAEDVTINADGTVTICMHELGVVAFLVDASGALVGEDIDGAVMSPATEG